MIKNSVKHEEDEVKVVKVIKTKHGTEYMV